MLALDVKQASNSQPTFEIQLSDAIYTLVLDGSSEVTLAVPEGANKVIFASTNNFYWAKASFTLPSGTTPTLRVCELNPGIRTVEFGETIYLRSIAADTHIQMSFFKGGA